MDATSGCFLALNGRQFELAGVLYAAYCAPVLDLSNGRAAMSAKKRRVSGSRRARSGHAE
jgi:hypothetical protein